MSNEDKVLLAAVIVAAGCVYLGYEIGTLAGELNEIDASVSGSTLGRLLLS